MNNIEITKRISYERPDAVCRKLHCKKCLYIVKAITQNTHYEGKGFILNFLESL